MAQEQVSATPAPTDGGSPVGALVAGAVVVVAGAGLGGWWLLKGRSPNTPHPWAWWRWAIGIGIAVSGTTNPLLLALVATGMVAVVMLRRSEAPWARSVKAYLVFSLFVIGMRVFFQMLLGAGSARPCRSPFRRSRCPDWAAGIRLGGAVTAEGLVGTLYDALRLAVMSSASVQRTRWPTPAGPAFRAGRPVRGVGCGRGRAERRPRS